jgi:chromosome segregation ATPase
MTDQELKEMIAGLTVAQKETERSLKETDRILKEYAERAEADRRKTEEARRKTEEARRKTEEARRKIEANLAEERRKTEAELAEERRRIEAELAAERRKTEEERRKTEEERRKTERVIRQVNKQLGELGNKFGSFTEGMALPSMEKILYRQFKMDVVAPRAKARLNGQTLEIDVLAYDNGSRNEAYLVEVKSHLTREGIEQMIETIERFPKFFGAHRDRTLYGVIAAVDIPDNLRGEVLKKGLYLARIHDGEFELLTPRGFKPAPFGPAARENGKTKKRASGKK